MKPFSQPIEDEWKLLNHRVNSPRRRTMCGELAAVFNKNPAELPGMKTVQSPATSRRTRNGLVHCFSSSKLDDTPDVTLDKL